MQHRSDFAKCDEEYVENNLLKFNCVSVAAVRSSLIVPLTANRRLVQPGVPLFERYSSTQMDVEGSRSTAEFSFNKAESSRRSYETV